MKSILVVSDLDRKMRMKVNISDYITGGVLSMECNDKKQRLVAYFLINF